MSLSSSCPSNKHSDVETSGIFDPLGLAKGKDDATLGWYRAAELKHGRVCMLASVGYIVQGLYHLPDSPFEAAKPVDALIKVRLLMDLWCR